MSVTLLDQETQIRQTFPVALYDDTVAPSEANFETNPANLLDDMNNLRSQASNFLDVQAGDWFDDLNVPATLETGEKRGINNLNTDLHAVEKKRVLRDVYLIDSIAVPSEVDADGILTAASQPANNDTVVIGTQTYTFETAFSDTPNYVLISAVDASGSLDNMIAAVTNGAGEGTVYGTGTAANTSATAAAGAGDTVDVTALLGGTQGNLIVSTTPVAVGGLSFATATLTGGAGDIAVLAIGELPTNTTAAIGAVTTLGTVAAYNSSFLAATLDEVAGGISLNPLNLSNIVDASTRDPILSDGRKIYGLFQTESNTDGSTMTGTTPNRAQITFVRQNALGTDLELCPSSSIAGHDIAYSTRERVRLEDLNEVDFLNGAVVDVGAGSASVTRQVAYTNQGTTPVNVVTDSTIDLEGAGLSWAVRDDLEAMLFEIVEGSAGGTSQINIGVDVDEFDVDAAVNNFLNGVTVDSGAAGTTINVGVTANQIDSGGALTIQATLDLKLDAVGGDLRLTDQYEPAGWSEDGIQLSDAAQTWTDFETAFGEVGLMDAILQAYNKTGRRKVYSICTVLAAADADVSGPANDNNLSVDLGDLSAGTFISDYDIYLNGNLRYNGVDAAANKDVYPGTSLANGQLKFENKIKLGDVIIVIDWVS